MLVVVHAPCGACCCVSSLAHSGQHLVVHASVLEQLHCVSVVDTRAAVGINGSVVLVWAEFDWHSAVSS